MERIKAFLKSLGQAAVNLWTWFRGLPVVKPLFALAYSRKSMITLAVVAFMIRVFPELAPVESEVVVVVAQVIVIGFVALGQLLGIAIEDAATKSLPDLPNTTGRAG